MRHASAGLPGNAGQQTLCDEFWEDHTTVCLPIWRLLDDCRDLAPVVMSPLLQLLSALATGQQAAFQVIVGPLMVFTWHMCLETQNMVAICRAPQLH